MFLDSIRREEIRTPMNGVLGFTQLLKHSDLSVQQQDFVTAIRSSAESLLRVINDVLDFSKIESGHMEIEASPFSLQECIEESAAGKTRCKFRYRRWFWFTG